VSPATVYTFNPATSNTVTIPVSATVADVRLSITTNSGAPAGQVAEFQVIGTPAPNPDLTVTGSSWTPTSPVETDSITVSATVRNAGTAGSGSTDVNLYLGATKVGTAPVGVLAAGASTTVSANIGPQNAGSYQLVAKVDEAYVNGSAGRRLPHNLNISFAYVEGESVLMGLNKDVALSSGSACTSATLEPSYVISALGVDAELAHSSIRFGLHRFSTEEEVDFVGVRTVEVVLRLREMSPLYELAKEGVDLRSINWKAE